jgi:hypothetical protein
MESLPVGPESQAPRLAVRVEGGAIPCAAVLHSPQSTSFSVIDEESRRIGYPFSIKCGAAIGKRVEKGGRLAKAQ